MELHPIASSGSCCHVHQNIHLHLPASDFLDEADEVDLDLELTFHQRRQHRGEFGVCDHGAGSMHSRHEALGFDCTW